ncbi:protein SODIUM POTASSIUM ROOT DEFECTIVE 2-like [Phragmites australis]|uniref:protein SODIUM POTASSIUM ROOT DEFECTIVE 2-like n=1 Tax=Phragmites australis TaxID=29695 RepID=UPI002D77AA0C|nr:protein SODIUM POTASSIUM ROOT DEFECTIVE 2-like [Phragmites australis]
MAFVLFKDSMKQRLQGLSGLSCSSPASTSVVVASGRTIDRHSPHVGDPRRRLASSVPRPPTKPNSSSTTSDSSSSSMKQQHRQLYHDHGGNKKKKNTTAAARSSTSEKKKTMQQESPARSSRFLLNSSRLQEPDDDITILDSMPTFVDSTFRGRGDAALLVPGTQEALPGRLAESSAGAGSSFSSSSFWSSSETGGGVAGAGAATRVRDDDMKVITRSCSMITREHQVVVLRVSLHCKGCAGKVKKHISKMEGVTSFDIDIATKKVTVAGDVTPLGVLNSISKVKSAQFWPDSASPPRASASF